MGGMPKIRSLQSAAAKLLVLRRSAIPSLKRWPHIAGSSLAGPLFPPRCVICQVDLDQPIDELSICPVCRRGLAPPVANWCQKCGAPVTTATNQTDECVHCQGEKFPWETVIALGNHDGDLSKAVVRTKSPQGEIAAVALGRLLCECRRPALIDFKPDILMPLPMHWSRRLVRGTNGPDFIAGAIAKSLGLQVRARWLKRGRLTALQTDVSPTDRKANQRKSFRVSRPARLAGRRILLVDDVLTTGSTAVDATKTLLAAGAAAVAIAVIARGVGADIH
jgi:ComF family protein